MTDDAQRWKEKYLKSIEDQEKLERRWNARLDLLRRGLVRSTLAAEGADKAVDACMKEMREVVRTDNMDAALATLIPRLEKAVLDSEQRRETRVTQISTALTSLVTQLQALPLPKEASRPLRKFAGSLDKRAGQSRELPVLLTELSSLQGQALSALDPNEHTARPGLLERLFGNRAESGAQDSPEASETEAPLAAPLPAEPLAREELPAPSATTEPAPKPVQAEIAQEPAAFAPPQEAAPHAEPPAAKAAEPKPETETEVESEPAKTASAEARAAEREPAPTPEPVAPAPTAVVAAPAAEPGPNTSEPPTRPVLLDSLPLPDLMAQAIAAADPDATDEELLYVLPESPEPSYSSVATHIESTMLGMLDDLTLPERLLPLADSMRGRLAHGLNWYELLPLLDDVAILTLGISDHGQLELQRYLAELNERFDHFIDQLHITSEGHNQSQDAAHQLDRSLREQVGGLRESVNEAPDAAGLRRVLENRLDGLVGTLDEHRKQRELRDQETAERLQGLAQRVASMEQEALHYRENLEVQRQKALLDPLTGLPNRAAWGERLDQAISQREQEGSDLQVAIFDLDHFKAINDGYGHLAGDKVLKIVATVLGRHLRSGDFLARFGGEEFVLLMPATQPEAATTLLETLRSAIEACPFHFKGERVTITVSIGSTAFAPGEPGDSALKRADQALYKAKAAGRNRVQQS